MDHAGFDFFDEAQDGVDIFSENRSSEAVLDTIRRGERFFQILSSGYRQHWAENFFFEDAHLGIDVIEDGRLDEVTFAEMFRLGVANEHVDQEVIMRRIEEESQRMRALVDDLLLLARLDERREIEPTTFDLAVLAADACSDAVAIDPDRSITLDAPEPVVILGDQPEWQAVSPPPAPIWVRSVEFASTV